MGHCPLWYKPNYNLLFKLARVFKDLILFFSIFQQTSLTSFPQIFPWQKKFSARASIFPINFRYSRLDILHLSNLTIFHHSAPTKDALKSPIYKKYSNFALSCLMNILDHFLVWCRLSRTGPLAELEVVSNRFIKKLRAKLNGVLLLGDFSASFVGVL